VLLDRRKDFAYRVRDQAILPASGRHAIVSPFRSSAVPESSGTILPTPLRPTHPWKACRNNAGAGAATQAKNRARRLVPPPCDFDRLRFSTPRSRAGRGSRRWSWRRSKVEEVLQHGSACLLPSDSRRLRRVRLGTGFVPAEEETAFCHHDEED
jgi:hypothetical protein